ncbi:MAG TPA: LysE family transporter [Opitutaceae bacterium]|nr:LysE family transporter [Opitutaceae bacterium]
MIHFLQGFLIGFALAAPVGPVGLLCIRRSIAHGRLAGFLSGLGAAFADGILGLVAALGLTTITGFVARHTFAFQLSGGLFMLAMGAIMLRAHAARPSPEVDRLSTAQLSTVMLSTFAIAVLNPPTITACLGIFTSFAADLHTAGRGEAFLLVLGIFLGSTAWWLILSGAASALGRRLKTGSLRIIDLAAGGIIAAFGLWQLARLALPL